jgi:nucleoside-diphosphate-sugar epimerase
VTRLLVSGASGFIGLPLLRQIAREDREIHALFRRGSPPPIDGVSWHRVELFDRAAVRELMRELAPEELVHLAWCTDHGRFWHAQENITWLQCSLQLMCEFASRGGRRLVMLGTCAEYDWSAAAEPLAEARSPLAPLTLYGAAKDALRRVASAYAEQSGIELAWARPFLLYGPREDPARLVPSAIRALREGDGTIEVCGHLVRDLMHVEDVAGAVAALLDSPVVGAVNVASGVGVSLGEVAARLSRSVGRSASIGRIAQPARPGEPPRLVADVTRLREEVGYRPRWPLADGLADAVRWWEQHGG